MACAASVPGGPPDCLGTGVQPFVRFVLATTAAQRPCSSHAGRLPGTIFQEIWLTPGCSRGAVIHEFGHALGLFHEHQRPDRDVVLEVDTANAQNANGNLARLNLATPVGPHDISSIMHYPPFAFSADPSPNSTLPTILLRNRLSQMNGSIWSPVLNTGHTLREFSFGDFGAPGAPGSPDGIPDTLTLNGNAWEAVFGGGGTAWEPVNTSQIPMHFERLAFGDFGSPPGVISRNPGPPDGITDVLAHFGGRWQISFSGNTTWWAVQPSGTGVDHLLIADVGSPPPGTGFGTPGPADGQTDLVTTFSGLLWVSFGAQTRWRPIAVIGADLSLLKLGNRTGDSAAEILSDGLFSVQRTAP